MRTLLKSSKAVANRLLAHPSIPEDIQLEADQRKIKLEFILVQSSGEDMNTLKAMLENDELKPHVSKIFPFENMADAHVQIESGRTWAK